MTTQNVETVTSKADLVLVTVAVLGIVLTFLTSWVLSRTVLRGEVVPEAHGQRDEHVARDGQRRERRQRQHGQRQQRPQGESRERVQRDRPVARRECGVA